LKPDFGFKFSNFVSKELQLLTSYRIAAKSSRINLGLGPHTPYGVFLEDQAYWARSILTGLRLRPAVPNQQDRFKPEQVSPNCG
jgi:hypothetical protein